jgi:ferredoxin
MDEETVPLTVRTEEYETTLSAPRGANLRRTLLENGFDVYGTVSRLANCGGRGLCGTCGVRAEVAAGSPDPDHWHDRAAESWGYPRLSCQLTLDDPLTVSLVPKVVWGQLRPRRGGGEP